MWCIMRYFFVEPSKTGGNAVLISGSDAKHIKNVLRMKIGDRLGLSDGSGMGYEARITAFPNKGVEVSINGRFPLNTESPTQIIVAQAFLKEKKMDGLVRPLTELGISRWIPFIAKRSVPRPDKKRLGARIVRWEKIAKESLKQCRRSLMPEIGPVATFEEVLAIGKACDLRIAFWEDEAMPFDFVSSQSDRNSHPTILLMLGPEGGFTVEEMKKAGDCGFVTASLGPRILRSETASIAACTLVQYFFGDMGKNP